MMVSSRLEEYRRWHRLQRATHDIDPVYPVLREYSKYECLRRDEIAWLIFLHVAYYHLGSALFVFDEDRRPRVPAGQRMHLPTATERRGHRDPRKLEDHFRSLLDAFETWGGPYMLLAAPNWQAQIDRLLTIYGNGRWAAYKTAEMAQKVLGQPIQPTDAQHAESTGPRKGLHDVTGLVAVGNSAGVIAELDRRTVRLARDIGEKDIGYVETSLCDYHSLRNGHYYLGHDIDAMQAQIYQVPSGQTLSIFTARRHSLPHAYLGELNGWIAPDQERKRWYQRTGEILERS